MGASWLDQIASLPFWIAVLRIATPLILARWASCYASAPAC